MMLSFSLITVTMVAFPFANRTLHFVSHNGMVNLYMYVTSYFFEGYEKIRGVELFEEYTTELESSRAVKASEGSSEDVPDLP